MLSLWRLRWRNANRPNVFNGSPNTGSLHKDHEMYLKGLDGVEVAANYVRGWPADPSGGIKARNGKNLITARNYIDDTGILLYTHDPRDRVSTMDWRIYGSHIVQRSNPGHRASGISYSERHFTGVDKNLTYSANQFEIVDVVTRLVIHVSGWPMVTCLIIKCTKTTCITAPRPKWSCKLAMKLLRLRQETSMFLFHPVNLLVHKYMVSATRTVPFADDLFARHAFRDDCVRTKKGFYGVPLICFFTPLCNIPHFTFLPFKVLLLTVYCAKKKTSTIWSDVDTFSNFVVTNKIRGKNRKQKMIVNSKLYFMFDWYQDRERCVLYGLMLIIWKRNTWSQPTSFPGFRETPGNEVGSQRLSGKVNNDKNRW